MSESTEIKPKRHTPLLLRRDLPGKHRVGFVLYHYVLLLLACAGLTVCTLLLSYSNFTEQIFQGYFEHPIIVFLNYAIVAGLCLMLYGLIGRAWIAFLLTSVLCLGVALGNYYLIIIRSDPLEFEDLTCIREALAITEKQGYELQINDRVLLSVGSSAVLTVLLALLARWRMRWRPLRLIPVALGAAVFVGSLFLCGDADLFQKSKYYEYINTWSVTEIYVSRGVVYSFTRTALSGSGKPSGYSEKEVEQILAQYTEEDIPDDRKADVFVIMRESYADLSELESTPGAIDFSCYDTYHALRDEAVLWGNLVTNGFGGNTKNAERCFLTGDYTLTEWRKPANSYLWYLRQQGYYAEGAHPFNGWFYNRLNINRYLGFQNYMFREDGFDELVGADTIAEDDVLYDCIWNQYQTYLETNDGPYFSFSVTYEGHGPYHYTRNDAAARYVLEDATTADGYAMNNYLTCCAKRDDELRILVDRFRFNDRYSDRPIVLLIYGDHKATLGKDINNYTTAAYSHFGMDVDLSTAEGFFNYYSTDYVIWMNDAARELFGVDGGVKTGPTISPCYLMNVLFDTLGWGDGPAYLQAMADIMEEIPVYSVKGRISVDGELSTTVPSSVRPTYDRMRYLCWYWSHNFLYEDMTK